MAAEPYPTTRSHPLILDRSGNESLSLLVSLQRLYKERWAILLDAIFSNQSGERVILQNSFIHAKEDGQDLFRFNGVRIGDAPDFESAVSLRHTESSLLTKFWTFPTAIIPALVLSPVQGDSILVLGNPSPGRLLTMVQLLFACSSQRDAASNSLQQTKSLHRKKAKEKLRGHSASKLSQDHLNDAAVKHTNGLSNAAPAKKAHYEGFSHLPWHVYGEGEPPAAWRDEEKTGEQDSLVLQIQQNLAPVRAPQGWSLGNLLTGVLQRGIQAGCCVVRTSSGDWAEACAQEEQKAQQEQKAQRELKVQKEQKGNQNGGSPGATLSSTGSGALCGSCFRGACLGDGAEGGEYVPLQDARQGDEPRASSTLLVQLPDAGLDGRIAKQLQNLLEHHVPLEFGSSIRIEGASGPEPWWKSATDGSFDCVLIEAEAIATKDAVLAACQSGQRQPWLVGEAKQQLKTQQQLIVDAFYSLRPGGHLLFCSNSLASEETDGLIEQCMNDLQGRSQNIDKPLASIEDSREAISIAMKKWGAERTELGWRFLPDLSFQSPQYFSLLCRV